MEEFGLPMYPDENARLVSLCIILLYVSIDAPVGTSLVEKNKEKS
jgi:hypothetical protein